MRSFLFIIIAFIGATGLSQEQHRKIGAIEFFGSSGMDLQRIKTNFPTKEGDQLPEPVDAMLATIEKTDRNKGGYVLEALTASRNPKVLGQLRSRALDSLLEMARWRSQVMLTQPVYCSVELPVSKKHV